MHRTACQIVPAAFVGNFALVHSLIVFDARLDFGVDMLQPAFPSNSLHECALLRLLRSPCLTFGIRRVVTIFHLFRERAALMHPFLLVLSSILWTPQTLLIHSFLFPSISDSPQPYGNASRPPPFFLYFSQGLAVTRLCIYGFATFDAWC